MQPPVDVPVARRVLARVAGVVRVSGVLDHEPLLAGERVVQDGRLTRIDDTAIIERVERTSARIAERLGAERLIGLKWPVV